MATLADGIVGALATAKAVSLAAGTPIYRQGEILRDGCAIGRGYVRLEHTGRSGQQTLLGLFGAGAVLGLVVPAGAEPRPSGETLRCHGPAQLVRFQPEELRAAAARSPALQSLLVSALVRQEGAQRRRIAALTRESVAARVGASLLALARDYPEPCRHGHCIDVRLTHQDVADLLAASRPGVSAALHHLRAAGLIDYTRRFICIDDLERLAHAVDA